MLSLSIILRSTTHSLKKSAHQRIATWKSYLYTVTKPVSFSKLKELPFRIFYIKAPWHLELRQCTFGERPLPRISQICRIKSLQLLQEIEHRQTATKETNTKRHTKHQLSPPSPISLSFHQIRHVRTSQFAPNPHENLPTQVKVKGNHTRQHPSTLQQRAFSTKHHPHPHHTIQSDHGPHG